MNFECHITVKKPKDLAPLIQFGAACGWKTSWINDDPVLGPGDRFYFTAHNSSYISLYGSMLAMSKLLWSNGTGVLREKIELIMTDKVY